MSWSFNGTFRNVEHAKKKIAADAYLPQAIKDYITAGLEGLQATDPERVIVIEGHGHVCTGRADYETTSASLSVKPLSFSAD